MTARPEPHDQPPENSPGEPGPGSEAASGWQQVFLPDATQHCVWLWYDASHTPQNLVVKIPAATFLAVPTIGLITMRRLLYAVAVDPAVVSLWYAYGLAHQCLQGQSPLLDQPLPPPNPMTDLDITVYIGPTQIPQAPPMPAPMPATHIPSGLATTGAGLAANKDTAQIFDRIDAEWKSCQQMRHQLMQIRKRMSAMLIKLSSLNRDLSPDERLHSDRQDKNDWMEARRWLRDVAAKVSRYIKEFDIGEASQAGKREWFEHTYEQIVVPRRPSDRLPRLEREYETYRKQLQTLMANMNNAYSSAVQDGERRAQQVLTHIASKVRSAKRSRP